MASIRQDVAGDFLPDFRNLGVLARVLVGANALVLAGALLQSLDPAGAAELFMRSATLVEPLLLAAIVVLAALSSVLARLPYWAGCAVVLAVVLALAAAVHALLAAIVGETPSDLGRALVLSALAALCLLGYFRLHTRAYSPALA